MVKYLTNNKYFHISKPNKLLFGKNKSGKISNIYPYNVETSFIIHVICE